VVEYALDPFVDQELTPSSLAVYGPFRPIKSGLPLPVSQLLGQLPIMGLIHLKIGAVWIDSTAYLGHGDFLQYNGLGIWNLAQNS
jgi:hypothetical protein